MGWVGCKCKVGGGLSCSEVDARARRRLKAGLRTRFYGGKGAGYTRRGCDFASAGMTVDEALNAAVGHLQGGRTGEAQTLCGEVLRVVPGHADAMHILAIAQFHSGQK